MKAFSSIFAASILAVTMAAGCSWAPHNETADAPKIKVSTSRDQIATGESARITANTVNLVGAKEIKWNVSPNVGKFTADGANGTTGLFSSTQAGTYLITASADAGNGHWVTSQTTVTVNGLYNGNGQAVGSDSNK